MSRFARLSPKKYQRDEPPNRIANLTRGTYLAVQRTLENVWFGVSAPLKQACDDVCREYDEEVDEQSIKWHIAEFVNLLVRKIFFNGEPESIQNIRKMDWMIKEELYKGIIDSAPHEMEELKAKAESLQKILAPLRDEVREKDHYVKKFRERKRQYDKNFAQYQQRMRDLEEAEKKLQDDLAVIAGLSPIEIKNVLAATQSLTRQEL